MTLPINNILHKTFLDWRRWLAPAFMAMLLLYISEENFLLFHTLAEVFAIVIAVLLAVVAWYTYSFSNNHYLAYLGTGYLWVAVLDLMHTLTYKGLNLFGEIPDDTSIKFWIVTRFFEAGLLLSAPLFLVRRVDRPGMMAMFAMFALLVNVIVFKGYIPTLYVEGSGLTTLKVYAEYAIILLLLAAAAYTLRQRNLFDRRLVNMIILSIALTIAAELCFTLYESLHAIQLVAGHIFKLFSYWAIFIAIVQTALNEPYEILARTSGTYDAVPTPTVVVNRAGIIQQVNREACRVTGMHAKDLLEQDCHAWFHSRHVARPDCVICQYIADGKPLSKYEMQKSDMSWWEFALSPFDSLNNSELMVHVCTDISDRKHAEQSLLHQANYDSLTQLPNRALALDRLLQAIEIARRDGKHVAVMFIDLDNFKNINDTLGHVIGDRLLVAVSNVLESSIRQSDTLARWGGDEFIVILGDLDGLGTARPIADKILRQLSSPLYAGDREFIISASIGISGFPDNGDEPNVLLSNADAAMYLAKADGRNTVRYYTADLNAQAAARMEMERYLRNAVENNELSLHYQPQARVSDRALVGAEALLRWRNPVLGNVRPDIFIPLAEASGLINPIGEWVLQAVCRDIAAWRAAGYGEMRISINISSIQFVNEGFIPFLRQTVLEHNIDPRLLELEITETLLLGDEQRNIGLFNQLRLQGFNLSLDDFGTGYASLSYLKKFPFNEVKIDRQFVMDADTNESDASLCRAIVAMAHGLGLTVVAEGVETVGQWQLLRDNRVELAQGYLYSKPLPEPEFRSFLRQHHGGVAQPG